MNRDGVLDPRAWLLWGVAASLPALVGRHPLPLVATLAAVLGVRAAWVPAGGPGQASWNLLLRWAVVFAAIGALFNVLTVPLGDRIIVAVPERVPIVGDRLTVNALVYGLLGGLAVLTLVVIGVTLGSVLDWSTVLRLLPDRLAGLAVAGTVAFAFVPATAAAFREVREAQAARGFRVRSPRDLPPLLVPLLAGGLERAMILAEAMEARAFGASARPDQIAGWRGILLALGLGLGTTGGYLAVVDGRFATLSLAVGAVCFVGALIDGRSGVARGGRTRYRPTVWTRVDSVVAGTSLLAGAIVLATLRERPAALRYDPYPTLAAPTVDLPLLIGLALLLMPAWLVPRPATAERQERRLESDAVLHGRTS